jgi:hypothetical protein
VVCVGNDPTWPSPSESVCVTGGDGSSGAPPARRGSCEGGSNLLARSSRRRTLLNWLSGVVAQARAQLAPAYP